MDRGVHLSPRIHQEYTFRHRSACRTPAENRQEYLTSGQCPDPWSAPLRCAHWMPILGHPGAHEMGVPSRNGDPRPSAKQILVVSRQAMENVNPNKDIIGMGRSWLKHCDLCYKQGKGQVLSGDRTMLPSAGRTHGRGRGGSPRELYSVPS